MEKDRLDRFISAVSTAADKQVNDILSEAEQERNDILSAAREHAEEEGKRHLSDNMKMTSGKCVRMISKAELEMKKEVLLCRERLTAELFGKIQDRIAEYRRTPEYEDKLCSIISEESDLEGARVLLSPEDMHLSEAVAASSGNKVTVAADDSVKLGGMLILRTEKGTVTDRTFDCALKEQQSIFAAGNLLSAQEGEAQ